MPSKVQVQVQKSFISISQGPLSEYVTSQGILE